MANIARILSIDPNAQILLEKTGAGGARLQWVTLVAVVRIFAVTDGCSVVFDSDADYGDAIAEFDADDVREILSLFEAELEPRLRN